jgi:hypothetical protein
MITGTPDDETGTLTQPSSVLAIAPPHNSTIVMGKDSATRVTDRASGWRMHLINTTFQFVRVYLGSGSRYITLPPSTGSTDVPEHTSSRVFGVDDHAVETDGGVGLSAGPVLSHEVDIYVSRESSTRGGWLWATNAT